MASNVQALRIFSITRSGLRALTEISRVIVLQSAAGWSSARVTRHVPAAGSATSANQEIWVNKRSQDRLMVCGAPQTIVKAAGAPTRRTSHETS
jgi:hypothetical protein